MIKFLIVIIKSLVSYADDGLRRILQLRAICFSFFEDVAKSISLGLLFGVNFGWLANRLLPLRGQDHDFGLLILLVSLRSLHQFIVVHVFNNSLVQSLWIIVQYFVNVGFNEVINLEQVYQIDDFDFSSLFLGQRSLELSLQLGVADVPCLLHVVFGPELVSLFHSCNYLVNHVI